MRAWVFAAAFLAAAPSSSAPAPGELAEFVSPRGAFSCRLPRGWIQAPAPDAGSGVDGVEVRGPSAAQGASVRISVDYYAKGNPLYSGPEQFVATLSRPDPLLKVPGEKYHPVSSRKIAGRKARVFEREVFDFIPPGHPQPVKVPVFERFVVVPGKDGFFVLRYHAPREAARRELGSFQGVLSSFKPKVP